MTPVDFRNATFDEIQSKLAGQRAETLAAWHQHGPGTTAEVCAKAGLSILTFRPRTTELYQLGFVRLEEAFHSKGEGVYRARGSAEHRAWFAEQQIDARPGQRLLPLR